MNDDVLIYEIHMEIYISRKIISFHFLIRHTGMIDSWEIHQH